MEGVPAFAGEMMMLSGATTLVLPGLVQGRSLCYAVAMFPEDDFRVGRKGEKPFDSLPNAILVSKCIDCLQGSGYLAIAGVLAYRILILRPPSILVQTLRTSSPLLTLSTAPQTSSPASAN